MSASEAGQAFGRRLREAREQRGISLRQIANTTKISIHAFEGLERGDISKLPGGIFSRAFVRSYAQEAGLDPEAIVRDFLVAFPDDLTTAGSPQAVRQYADTEETAYESRQQVAGVALKLLLISLPLAGLLVYVGGRSPGSQPAGGQPGPTVAGQATAGADEAARAAMPPGDAALPDAPAPVPVAEEPAAVVPDLLETGPRAGAAVAAGGVRLEVAPTGDCWVSLTVDGTLVLARVMRAGERVIRRVRDEAIVQIGDAGAFAFSLDGRPGRVLGGPGEVRTIRIAPDTVTSLVR